MKYFSMFSGIGGFELGIERAYQARKQQHKKRNLSEISSNSDSSNGDGGRLCATCIGYSEIDKYAIKVYERHFKHKNYGDATTIDPNKLPDFDLLVGGFPCQAFSIAGKRKGFEDTRGTLFFDIARILAVKKPKHLVLENVKGLLSHDQGRTFQTILGVLSDLGYGVEWQVLNSKDFGVPQNRERVIIVGYLGRISRPKVFPILNKPSIHEKEQQPTKRQKINRLNYSSERIQERDENKSDRFKPAQWRRTEKGKQFRRESQKQGKDLTPFGDGHRELVPKDSEIIGSITSQAIAKDSLLFENTRIRRLTPKECERLQGFPDDWTARESDTQRYKMCGNAVTVNVVQAIIERLLWEK